MKFLGKLMDPEGIILSEVTQSQKNSHDMYSLISGYYPRNLEYPGYKIQFAKHMKLKKNKVWTLCPFLELGTKHPWKELQRHSLELRRKMDHLETAIPMDPSHNQLRNIDTIAYTIKILLKGP